MGAKRRNRRLVAQDGDAAISRGGRCLARLSGTTRSHRTARLSTALQPQGRSNRRERLRLVGPLPPAHCRGIRRQPRSADRRTPGSSAPVSSSSPPPNLRVRRTPDSFGAMALTHFDPRIRLDVYVFATPKRLVRHGSDCGSDGKGQGILVWGHGKSSITQWGPTARVSRASAVRRVASRASARATYARS